MMDRLTEKKSGWNGHYMKCADQGWCDGKCGSCPELDRIVHRLAYYEDLEEQSERENSNKLQQESIKTNADKIRSMTDEELADILFRIDTREGFTDLIRWLEWLQQPAKEERRMGKKEELIELLSGYSLDTYEDIVYTAERLIEHGVEIPVRCKGCKYRAEYYNSGKYVCTLWQCRCCGSADYVKPDDFCSYGKRKDGDG